VRTRNHWTREKYSVLLVCTANICQSPIAEVLFKAFIKSLGQSEAEWRIESAGVFASPGHPATTLAQEAVAELGLDLSKHKSQMVTKELVQSFQLVLTME
jgi:protein-tyrosine-phosphatase